MDIAQPGQDDYDTSPARGHADPIRWEVIELDRGQLGVEVIFADGHLTVMQVTHDRTPANNVDVLFISRSRSDMQRLLLAIQGKMVLSPIELAEIEADVVLPVLLPGQCKYDY